VSAVSLTPYRRALASRPLRTILVLGTLVRGPVFASGVLITVHVVTTLGHSYAAAGALAAAATIAIAVSGPWRGRLLDLPPSCGPVRRANGTGRGALRKRAGAG